MEFTFSEETNYFQNIFINLTKMKAPQTEIFLVIFDTAINITLSNVYVNVYVIIYVSWRISIVYRDFNKKDGIFISVKQGILSLNIIIIFNKIAEVILKKWESFNSLLQSFRKSSLQHFIYVHCNKIRPLPTFK